MFASEGRSLTILDGAFFAHRSYHARRLPPLRAFVDHVMRVLCQEQPEFAAVAWDVEGPTFRHELYEDYKNNRPEKDPALVEHIEACHSALEELGLAVFRAPGFEGDDVVATLATTWSNRGGRVRIHTADKDILQLVDDRTCVVLQGEDFDATRVHERYGIGPERIPDWLALAGDAADGIPGIPGIGAQTASRLLASFGDMEAVISGVRNASDRRARAILGREEEARLFVRLTQLDCAVPLTWVDDELACASHPELWLQSQLAEMTRPYHRRLEAYRERAAAYMERLAIMTNNGADLSTARRQARASSSRIPLL